MSETQTLEGEATVKFLLNLLLKPNSLIYSATVIRDILYPNELISKVILGFP